MKIWNHEPKDAIIWTGDTPRIIGHASYMECDHEFGTLMLRLAKERKVDLRTEPPIPGALELRAQQEHLLAMSQYVRQNCLILPVSVFGAEDWRGMSKATLNRVAEALGMPPRPDEATKADTVEAIINFIAGSSSPVRTPGPLPENVGSNPTPAPISEATATVVTPSPGAQNTGATSTTTTQEATEETKVTKEQ